MKDLVGVFKILNLCADRVDNHPIYITPMLDILKICSLPFLKEKSSDETAYEQIAIESIAQLGKILDFLMCLLTNIVILINLLETM